MGRRFKGSTLTASPAYSMFRTAGFSRRLKTLVLYIVDVNDKLLASFSRRLRSNTTLEEYIESKMAVISIPSHSLLLENCATIKSLYFYGVQFEGEPTLSLCQALTDKNKNINVRLVEAKFDLIGGRTANMMLKMLFAGLNRSIEVERLNCSWIRLDLLNKALIIHAKKHLGFQIDGDIRDP